jgi:hypothetical protein
MVERKIETGLSALSADNPIVDLRSLVLKNSHSQRNGFTSKHDSRNKIKLEEHIETQRT